MAFTHGKSAYFAHGSQGSPTVEVNYSGYITNVSLPRSIDSAESSVLGLSAKTYLPGMSDGTISIEGRFDPAYNIILSALCATPTLIAWTYGPQGSTAGLPKIWSNGAAGGFFTSYNVEEGIDDVGSFSAEIQISGTITVTTF